MKSEILNILDKVKSIVPKNYPEDQEVSKTSGQPEWYGFEHETWSAGEQIRALLKDTPKLKKDSGIQTGITEIMNFKNLRRGRQSFVMLLGNISCKKHHQAIAGKLEDPDINGHILSTLYKMKVYDYQKEALKLTNSKFPWVRKLAKKYIEKSGKV